MGRKLPLLVILGIFVTAYAVAEMPFGFNGKSGEALRNAIREQYAPKAVVSSSDLSMAVFDPFNDVLVESSAGQLPSGYTWGSAVPSAWWSSDADMKRLVEADLYNLLPLTADVLTHRADLVPGAVENVKYETPLWKAGIGRIYDIPVELYEPPQSYLGELARIYFYMIVMYHHPVWTPRGFMMFDAESYPGLNSYASGLLMVWHKAHPVSRDELAKIYVVEKLQGNRNPFVDYPDLADYLWGDKAGMSFVINDERIPLRASYNMSDKRIDLCSPHIPEDAVWTIDGKYAQKSSYSPSELGVGPHYLAYKSASTRRVGYLKIKIFAK